MLTCGLVRSNFALAIWPVSFSAGWSPYDVVSKAGGGAGWYGAYSPRTFAMISFATFAGTSA